MNPPEPRYLNLYQNHHLHSSPSAAIAFEYHVSISWFRIIIPIHYPVAALFTPSSVPLFSPPSANRCVNASINCNETTLVPNVWIYIQLTGVEWSVANGTGNDALLNMWSGSIQIEFSLTRPGRHLAAAAAMDVWRRRWRWNRNAFGTVSWFGGSSCSSAVA